MDVEHAASRSHTSPTCVHRVKFLKYWPRVVWLQAIGQVLSPAGRFLSISMHSAISMVHGAGARGAAGKESGAGGFSPVTVSALSSPVKMGPVRSVSVKLHGKGGGGGGGVGGGDGDGGGGDGDGGGDDGDGGGGDGDGGGGDGDGGGGGGEGGGGEGGEGGGGGGACGSSLGMPGGSEGDGGGGDGEGGVGWQTYLSL